MSAKIIDRILSEVSLDQRVYDGVFRLEEESHMSALREYLVKRGIEESSAIEFCNHVLEGKYPERQAYNANGILVTFPTPEYKKQAISKGTHFEENPVRGKSNLFAKPPSKKKSDTPDEEKPKAAQGEKPSTGGETKTQLPVSQSQPADTVSSQVPAAQTTSAPMPTPEPKSGPMPEPTELPPPPAKTPQEREADKQAIKTMLKGDDYMLERVVSYLVSSASNHPMLMEEIRKRL